jgi:hypothetical protein
MTELQNCLPLHAHSFFIKLRNQKWEEARQAYQTSLADSRSNAAARNVLTSGFQINAEWELARKFHGDLAYGYFEAGVEACTLYEITIDNRLSECIASSVKDFLIAQQRNAVNNFAHKAPGAVDIPISARQQLSERPQSLPRYNEILIELEKARVESERAMAVQRAASAESKSVTVNVTRQHREGNRPDVLNVLIASPSDVNGERDAVIHV